MVRLIERKIKVEEFIELRKSVGWGISDRKAIEKGLKNSIYSVCAEIDNLVIGIARVVGDDGICFYIQDVIIKPEFQKMGIGRKIMESVMKYIAINATNGAVIGLMGAKGKEEFYEKFGFWKRPNDQLGHGMTQLWE